MNDDEQNIIRPATWSPPVQAERTLPHDERVIAGNAGIEAAAQYIEEYADLDAEQREEIAEAIRNLKWRQP